MTDIFLFCSSDIASYADDNTPYVTGNEINETLTELEKIGHNLFRWFSDNYMVANADKSHLLSSYQEDFEIRIENEAIKSSSQQKLLGV